MRKGKNGGKLKTGGNNGGGRPPKLPELDKLLAEVLDDEKEGLTAAKAILLKLRQKAIGGDIRAAEIILNRAYGKPKESVDVSTKGEKIEQTVIVIPSNGRT